MKATAAGPGSELGQWLANWGPLTTGLLAQKGAKVYAQRSGGSWHAAAVRDRTVVYPVLPERLTHEARQAFTLLCLRLHDNFCLMGPSAWLDQAEACLELPRFRRVRAVDYDFLVRPRRGTVQALHGTDPSERITVAVPRDILALFPLQEAYEKEEVLFSPDEFQPVASWLAFQKTLKEQLVLVLWEGRRPVAQARTNARYGAWAQIGGVYTDPSRRRRGLQKQLMTSLLHRLDATGQGACLFVKKENLAAVNLYYDLGFGDAVDYRISYWRREA